jgi:hypothetical protein
VEPDEIVALIFSCISSIFIFFYYIDKKKSSCHECKEVISHRKQNRYHSESEGEKFALCKKCYNRSQKIASLKAQKCSCCCKKFTTRTKILEWYGEFQTYFLCVACNRLALKMITRNFIADDIFPKEFIKSCSDHESLEVLVKMSGLKLESQTDFNSSTWNKFIVENTSFSSWLEMKNKAEKTLMQRQNDTIIKILYNKVYNK